MKKGNFLTALILLSCQFAFIAQETPTLEVKKMSVCEVDVYFGGFYEGNQYATVADFQKLAPQSVLLKGNMSGYNGSSGYGTTINSMFSVLMGIHFGDMKKGIYKPNPLLRLGFSYIRSSNLSNSLYKVTNTPSDTLTSSQTGQSYYVDSAVYRSYNMNYSSSQIRIDASLIYRTDPKARWSFYSGFGITAGLALNAYTNIYYNTYAALESANQSYYQSYQAENSSSQSETFKNASNFAFSGYIPLAVDFRMGKKRPFWKRTHLFYEFRPGVNVMSIPELSVVSGVCLQQGFGIKINWE